MNKAQQAKFNALYQRHVSALQRQGKAATTHLAERLPARSRLWFLTWQRQAITAACAVDTAGRYAESQSDSEAVLFVSALPVTYGGGWVQ